MSDQQQDPEAPAHDDFVQAGLQALRDATAERVSHGSVSFADLERAVAGVLSHLWNWGRAAPAAAPEPMNPPSETGQGDAAAAEQSGGAADASAGAEKAAPDGAGSDGAGG